MNSGLPEIDADYFLPSKQAEADKNLLVKFFLKPRQDKEASEREGRPIFKDVEYVDIKIPGDRSGGACRPASDGDKRRFAEHYRRFKDRMSQDVNEGTPLVEWPIISRSLCEELAFFHVRTIEQLANMSDSQTSKFMGLAQFREKAKQWLEYADKEKPFWEIDKKMKLLRAENEELKKSVAELAKRLDDEDNPSETPAQKRRGRKRTLKKALEQVS